MSGKLGVARKFLRGCNCRLPIDAELRAMAGRWEKRMIASSKRDY